MVANITVTRELALPIARSGGAGTLAQLQKRVSVKRTNVSVKRTNLADPGPRR